MLPGEIVARYPLRHWDFVNRKIAGIFKLLNEETGAKVGWNSCLVLCHTYFPPTKSYGYAAFAEDPRYFDDSVAFHNADTLMTATRSVFDVEAFMQNGPVVEVRCELKTDPSTVSGYYWSSNKGAAVSVDSGTMVEASVVISEKPPISLLIPFLKEKLTIKADN